MCFPDGGSVMAGRRQMHVDVLKFIARTQHPFVQYPPIPSHFKPLCFAMHEILENEWNYEMGRRR